MVGFLARLLPYALAFSSSFCIMILELVSSRLVAPHVGSSLTVWTSVIGIILGGICLGNVVGGRLADRVDPRRAVGPLFGIGSLLTLSTLWTNAKVGLLLPSPDAMNWELRTILVVALEFLIPATFLGTIGPVVAKMAVEQARRSGSAIGDVYFLGAVGSIAGTFVCGFELMYYVSISTIVLVVAAALAVLSASLIQSKPAKVLGLLGAFLLGLGSIPAVVSRLNLGSIELLTYQINHLANAGTACVLALALFAIAELFASRRVDGLEAADPDRQPREKTAASGSRSLVDLAVLSFVASLVFMSLEMVAGRLVQRHLGSSIYGWTSVIGVLLAGLSIGNFLGGKIADFIDDENQASWLFLASSMLIVGVIFLETQPWFIGNYLLGGHGEGMSILSRAIDYTQIEIGSLKIPLTWPYRILLVTTMMFLLPAISLGTMSPVVAKLAIDRLKRQHRTGTAIGQVYAWGMVGSIIGTFLTGFLLIDVLGTKGVILVLASITAFAATYLGTIVHALWAGIPMGLLVIAFMPFSFFESIGLRWGVRELSGNPSAEHPGLAWVDESNYYFIKVNNEFEQGGEVVKRTLVLDNLIHGYFILDHPERLDYDYEHIYSLVAYRAAKASGKIRLKPAPAGAASETGADKPSAGDPARGAEKPAEKSPAPAAKPAESKPADTKPGENKPAAKPAESKPAADAGKGGLRSVPARGEDEPKSAPKSGQEGAQAPAGESRPVPPLLPSQPFAEPVEEDDEEDMEHGSSLPNVEKAELSTLFLGGGAYCFQRHMQKAYPGTAVDVAEIDPAVTRANQMATGLPPDGESTIKTYWGDARQFVELHQDTKKYDIVFGDAFNDFSVPWHLTTREFNEKIKKMLTPNGVYMINIIDVYFSNEEAERRAQKEIARREKKENTALDEAAKAQIRKEMLERAHRYSGFVGSWTRTARQTFPHVYIFGTEGVPGGGLRETFVVVASMKPLDLADLGARPDDPKFYLKGTRVEPKPYSERDLEQIDERSKGIVLTDDYAPVENLLAPVAETRGDE